MAASRDCDARSRILQVMPTFVYFAAGGAPSTDPFTHPACGPIDNPRRRCQNHRRNNTRHVRPAVPDGAAPAPRTNWTVCDVCRHQCELMTRADRRLHGQPLTPVWGEDTVFHDFGLHHARLMAMGFDPFQMVFGAHVLGSLCVACSHLEIQRYWERRFGGARRQTAARAANTCRCEARLAKRLCYDDRADLLLDVRARSYNNADSVLSFLRFLYRDAANGHRVTWAGPGTAARDEIYDTRGDAAGFRFQRNGCRCGRDIPLGTVALQPHNAVPTPVAMCTACDGILVDVTHPAVVGWAANPTLPTLPLAEQGNLKLGRKVLGWS